MLLDCSETEIREHRTALGLVQGWDSVPVSGVENSFYYYSTYNAPDKTGVSDRHKVMIPWEEGPNRNWPGIGNPDYCCVSAAPCLARPGLRDGYGQLKSGNGVHGLRYLRISLYFEPLTVRGMCSVSMRKKKPLGVIVQFENQTPLNIAGDLGPGRGLEFSGTGPGNHRFWKDRDRFRRVIEQLGIPAGVRYGSEL